MHLQVRKIQVWSAELPDRPGSALAKLEKLAEAGADLSYIFTRPHPINPDLAILFLAPIHGPEQIRAAQAAGFSQADDVAMLAVEGDNQPGIGFQIMKQMAVAGINLRGLSISTLENRFLAFLAFDNHDIATLALRLLADLV
jgi:hypothetical protein